MSNILELSNRSRSGRKKIVFVAHEIYPDSTSVNENGLHWNETYVRNNLDSIKGMPICCEFLDNDKEIPYGHGYTGTEITDEGKEVQFLDSVVVGTVEYGEITNVMVKGKEIRALVCHGYIYVQRFPKFHKWLKINYKLGTVDTSIEITGIDGNDIVYENDFYSEEFRTPMKYSYSGAAILSIAPADPKAIVIECESLKPKEDKNTMDESKIIEVIQKAIKDATDIKSDFEAKLADLNAQLEVKNAEIQALTEAKEAITAECESKNAQLTELQSSNEQYKAELESAKAELAGCKKKELNSKLDMELKKYSDVEQKFAEAEINAFRENPTEEGVDSIVTKIDAGIGRKYKEVQSKAQEINNAGNSNDIFSEISSFEDHQEESIF